jgi:uncharacterized protein YigE (DUF2233 family)
VNRIIGVGFILFVIVLGVFVYEEYIVEPVVYNDISSPTPFEQVKPTGHNYVDFEFNQTPLRVAWIKVSDLSHLFLYSNLPNTETAERRMQEKSCRYLVNGGFYSKESRPIGAFVSEGETVNKGSKNNLFNGIFSVDSSEKARISNSLILGDVRFAVQSGPILINEGETQLINLKSDAGERRTVVAINSKSEVMFFSIFNPQSVYLGPYLEDLPQVLQEFERKAGIKFNYALNLDGGTASAFYSDSVSLQELSPIGSYFCIR